MIRTYVGEGCAEVEIEVAGWWVRLCAGVTFKPKRLRRWRGLVAVRLWRLRRETMGDWRLVLVQWRRSHGAEAAEAQS
jgi:hypothetical protein